MRKHVLVLIFFIVFISGCIQQPGAIYPETGAPATSEPIDIARQIDSGNTSSIPELIEFLDSNEVLMTEPPSLARDFAHGVLVSYSGEDFGYDKQRWMQWWNGQ